MASKGRSSRLPRWLIVVQRDKPEVYENLRESFAADGRVRVIRDRRRRERRAGPHGSPRWSRPSERRQQERRQPAPVREGLFGDDAAFFVIARGGDDTRSHTTEAAARPTR